MKYKLYVHDNKNLTIHGIATNGGKPFAVGDSRRKGGRLLDETEAQFEDVRKRANHPDARV